MLSAAVVVDRAVWVPWVNVKTWSQATPAQSSGYLTQYKICRYVSNRSQPGWSLCWLSERYSVLTHQIQNAFGRAHDNLQDAIVQSALSVKTISSDFEVKLTTKESTLRYVAAAMGMAGGLVSRALI